MAMSSKHTEAILELMSDGVPRTAREIAEGVGIKRQSGYNWVRGSGAKYIKRAGSGTNYGAAYVLRDDAHEMTEFTPAQEWRVVGQLNLGDILHVVGLRMEDGEKVIDLRGEGGAEVTMQLGE